MDISVYDIEYRDKKSLSTELSFAVACERVKGNELLNVRLTNPECASTFRNSATSLLRAMKRDGVISLFVFEDELASADKTECSYLLNKYPDLSGVAVSDAGIYIKL